MLKLARFCVLSTKDSSRQPLVPPSTAAEKRRRENDQLAQFLACDSASGHVPRATSTDDATTRITPRRHRPNGARKNRDARRDRVKPRLREPPLRLGKRNRPVKTPGRLAGPHAAETSGGVARRVRRRRSSGGRGKGPALTNAETGCLFLHNIAARFPYRRFALCVDVSLC